MCFLLTCWLLLVDTSGYLAVTFSYLIATTGYFSLLLAPRFSNNSLHGSVLEEKSSFKMLGLTFSSKLDWGSYMISIAKTASKKIGTLMCSMKFLSPEVVLYLYKSTIGRAWNTVVMSGLVAPSCYLELLDKLQKWTCRAVGSSLAASLEPLAHH